MSEGLSGCRLALNVPLYLLYRIASVEGVMHGLYVLWWVQEKQVSPALVALSLAAGDLVLFAVEWPTDGMQTATATVAA